MKSISLCRSLCLGMLFFALSLALAACGGSSSVTPPPPAGGFTNASLQGQYAFSMSGVDPSGGYLARVGSFIADGNGGITSGLEDLVQSSTVGGTVIPFNGGTYSIQSDGRGILVLQAAGGGGLQLNIVLSSTAQGVMLQTDLNDSSSGSFALQTPSDFSLSALNGKYVF